MSASMRYFTIWPLRMRRISLCGRRNADRPPVRPGRILMVRTVGAPRRTVRLAGAQNRASTVSLLIDLIFRHNVGRVVATRSHTRVLTCISCMYACTRRRDRALPACRSRTHAHIPPTALNCEAFRHYMVIIRAQIHTLLHAVPSAP